MLISELIGSIPLFSSLSREQREALAGQTKQENYASREQILRRGTPGDTLYIIVSGQVKVHAATIAGSEVTLAVMGPGEYFGELSLLDDKPRSADVSALVDTECLLLSRTALHDAIREHSEIAWRLLKHLSHLVRVQNTSIETFASRDVTGRVALLLLRLAENHGVAWLGGSSSAPIRGVRISVPLTRADIGAFVGATREHVTNIVNGFRRSGLMTADAATRELVLLDREKLRKRAQWEENV